MFDGKTYDARLDRNRLTAQLDRVRAFMNDGQWRTLAGIAVLLGYPEASVSARLRDLRKQKFGGRTVLRRRVEGGLYEYRLVPRPLPPYQSAPTPYQQTAG
jgi:hypothetical protein